MITEEEGLRYAKIDKTIKRLTKERDALNARIKEAFVRVGTYVIGGVIVKRTSAVQIAEIFDAEAFMADHPVRTNRKYYRSMLDISKIPAELRAEYTTEDRRVVQRLQIEVKAK